MNKITACSILALGLLVVACDGDGPIAPSNSTDSNLAWACFDYDDGHCQNEPPLGDPDTAADGVFLGEEFNPENCDGPTDADDDGLNDFCEFQLAVVFRPMLSTSIYDTYLGRESYWAAAPTDDGRVTIVYMIGYYTDPGPDNCWWSPPVGCAFHDGDNEFVVATVSFEEESQHWQLDGMFMSAHWGEAHDFSDWYSAQTSVEYPIGKHRTYARVWVSKRKHANYNTQYDCDNGGVLWADNCEYNIDDVRVSVSPNRNVGSPQEPFFDEVESSGNTMLHPGVEYFWTDKRFCGWLYDEVESRTSCSGTSYNDVLLSYLGG